MTAVTGRLGRGSVLQTRNLASQEVQEVMVGHGLDAGCPCPCAWWRVPGDAGGMLGTRSACECLRVEDYAYNRRRADLRERLWRSGSASVSEGRSA